MSKQTLTLEIDNVTILRCGPDRISLRVECPEIINEACKGYLKDGRVGTDIYGDHLHFGVEITRGCGEKLLELLGLKADKIYDQNH